MSDIEKEKFRQIGIDLINEYRKQRGIRLLDWLVIDTPEESAFIRSIQLHENTKKELQDVKQELADFRQEVSDALWDYFRPYDSPLVFQRFIIPQPKPDPLVEAYNEALPSTAACHGQETVEHICDKLRAALDELGFEIKEKSK